MCGIAGIIDDSLTAYDMTRALKRMAASMVHRGPDDEGILATDGAGLAMRRLSIIDVAGGQQPIGNEDGAVQVVCNGEIYNYRDLRTQLKSRGHQFRTASDVEVIVHLYEEQGPDCIRELHGMFGLAIWDERQRRLVLARDRMGKKPLFYAHLGNRLLFGSEIKAILRADATLAEPDVTAVLSYLRWGYVPEPDTMFQHVQKLRAAHVLVLENDTVTTRPYWQVDFAREPSNRKTAREWVEELDSLIERTVRERLMSEVPLGVFLSGGLDSSAIVAYAHRAGLHPIKTFTIGFDRPEWDES